MQDFFTVTVADFSQSLDFLQIAVSMSMALETMPGALYCILHPIHTASHTVDFTEASRSIIQAEKRGHIYIQYF